MCFAYWITKAIDTISEYVTLIAFALRQWIGERASVLRYTHIACLVHVGTAILIQRNALKMRNVKII
jgi:hypothetical protein